MKKFLLVYDVDWWVLGKHAMVVQSHNPNLEIASIQSVYNRVAAHGAKKINDQYEVISAMCLGLAEYLLKAGVRVDSSLAVSYFYFTKNQPEFKEWLGDFELNPPFINKYLTRINKIGCINPKLASFLGDIVPNCNVKYLKQFVDTELFKPKEKKDCGKLVIGWVGDVKKKSKNYETLYKPIKDSFADNSKVEFKEATMDSYVPVEKMPNYYHSIDLLLITGNNEGGPAPALEAYGCGVPVISTNVGYVKEVAPSSAKHLVLDSTDPAEYIKVITHLLDQRDELLKYGKEGSQSVLNNYSIEKTVPEWNQFLFEM
ncbi:glycosyltransferase family 4 protein [Mesobacillus subterraneus]|uniref:glycosyltransferase family 4 protein n=1 Tax=Mesobacillus subterraneus TaxID=285983 RepID=UPI001CFE5D6C|nr:glycosyltransferase family 4 protein [Mesobacillus subterraneus]WLR54786.1 glycosyltransferase family 4 protein [Mesobacillus subterraneus]